jgi:hypothetical protein
LAHSEAAHSAAVHAARGATRTTRHTLGGRCRRTRANPRARVSSGVGQHGATIDHQLRGSLRADLAKVESMDFLDLRHKPPCELVVCTGDHRADPSRLPVTTVPQRWARSTTPLMCAACGSSQPLPLWASRRGHRSRRITRRRRRRLSSRSRRWGDLFGLTIGATTSASKSATRQAPSFVCESSCRQMCSFAELAQLGLFAGRHHRRCHRGGPSKFLLDVNHGRHSAPRND